MARIHLIVKYTFFVIMVFTAGLVIERLTGIKRWWKPDSLRADDLIYNSSSPMVSKNFGKMLNKHYVKCLTEPSKPFCLLSADKKLEVFRINDTELLSEEQVESRFHNITSDLLPRRRRIHSLLMAFSKFIRDSHVRIVILEPSILFCLLSSTAKFNMLTKGFNPGQFLGSKNVVTVGVFGEDSKKLDAVNLTSEMLYAGFKIKRFRKWIGQESEKTFETVQYFYILQDVAIHVVVFHARNNYLWHAGLDPEDVDFEGLLFVNEDIFENFTLLPLNLPHSSIRQLFLPQNLRFFMREMESSRLVRCKGNSSDLLTEAEHPILTREQLGVRAAIAIKELKLIFAPYAAFFWLWSKTLLGWFFECYIFHYDPSLHLAIKFSSVQELNISEVLADNEFLKVGNSSELTGKYGHQLDCHGLLVNLYIIYEDNGLIWYRSDDDVEEQLAIKYPVFDLCSSEIYGQKIQVPCNSTEVLKAEFSRNITQRFRRLTKQSGNSLI